MRSIGRKARAGGSGTNAWRWSTSRDPERLREGDAVDFWRVEAIEPDRLLRLRAEMKLPGRAWLQFEVHDAGGTTVVRQTAIFEPRGLAGLLYWYALFPVHGLIFGGMLRGIGRAAAAAPEPRAAPPPSLPRQAAAERAAPPAPARPERDDRPRDERRDATGRPA